MTYGGFQLVMGYPKTGWFLRGKIPLKWMTGGTPISGNLHITWPNQQKWGLKHDWTVLHGPVWEMISENWRRLSLQPSLGSRNAECSVTIFAKVINKGEWTWVNHEAWEYLEREWGCHQNGRAAGNTFSVLKNVSTCQDLKALLQEERVSVLIIGMTIYLPAVFVFVFWYEQKGETTVYCWAIKKTLRQFCLMKSGDGYV